MAVRIGQSSERRGVLGLLKRFRREKDGVTAIEFALLFTPFMMFLFASFEVAMVFFSNSTLENSVMEAARQIRTGQVQSAGLGKTEFKNMICDRVDVFLDCSNIKVDVQTLQDFDDFSGTDPIDEDGNLQITENFNPGGPGDPVIVIVYYQHGMLFPSLMEPFTNLAGGNVLLSAASAFRNEPF